MTASLTISFDMLCVTSEFREMSSLLRDRRELLLEAVQVGFDLSGLLKRLFDGPDTLIRQRKDCLAAGTDSAPIRFEPTERVLAFNAALRAFDGDVKIFDELAHRFAPVEGLDNLTVAKGRGGRESAFRAESPARGGQTLAPVITTAAERT